MGLFGSRSKISRQEFRESKSHLRNKDHLSRTDIKNVEKIFHGDLNEPGSGRGIDRKELARSITWMRKYPSKHSLSKKQINALEKRLKERL